MHLKMVLSEEAMAEVEKFLDRKEYYVSDKGTLFFSSSTDVLDSVLRTLTRDPVAS